MNLTKGIASLVLVASLAMWCGNAIGAVPAMTMSDLTEASEAIVYGRVLSLVPHWDDAHENILTTVTVQPLGYMKGDLGSGKIEFEMPGGVVGDVGLAVSDVPEFEVGEEVVLFLREEFFRVVGWCQGKYRVEDGVVLGTGMSIEEFGAKVIELAGLTGDGIRTADGAVIQRAEVTLPLPLEKGDEVRPEPEPVQGDALRFGDITILTENFEGTFPGANWTLIDNGGTGHLWGKDNSKAHGGTYSIWECAAGGSAQPPGSNYVNGMQTFAIYGPFDLSDATSAQMTFWRSVQTAGAGDVLFWGGSGDGGGPFSGFQAYGGTGAWAEQTFDLATWLSDSSVWIAFVFQSDGSGTDRGGFVDDVEITKTVPSGTSPTIDSITPDNGPAGTGSGFLITITGSNFGATQGASVVRFLQDPLAAPPNDYENADYIDSWSDTQIICNVPERASSGTVNVVVGGDPGVGDAFTVSYSVSTTSWAYVSEPMGEDVRVNPSNNDVPAADALDAVIKGMQEWNAAGGAEFSFTYAGQTGVCSSTINEINEICFGSTGGSLATNYSWFVGNSLVENNIIFNDSDFTFSTDLTPGTYDIQSIATHELGHSLRLLDLYGTADWGKTMYGRTSPAQDWHRTIETADKDGIQYFYGAQTVNITTRNLPDPVAPVLYSAGISATGGTPPYSFALRSGTSLPSNLSLGADGTVSGYFQESGTFYFTVRVTDDDGNKDSQVIRLYAPAEVPVALERFSARAVKEGVLVEWSLSSGSDLGDFYVHRSVGDEEGRYEVLNDEPLKSSGPFDRHLSYLDRDVIPGTLYFYKLESREGQGGDFFGPVSAIASSGRALAHWLGQNRPNPFSPARDGVTMITFSLPSAGSAAVRVYDAAGRLVAVPFDGDAKAGETDVLWNGTGVYGEALPAGIYFYELYTPGFGSKRKMALMR